MDCSKQSLRAVLLDFNGTLFFDTPFHLEAWTKVYREFYKDSVDDPGSSVCGPRNDDIIRAMAPHLNEEERTQWSVHKESLYRQICREHPDKLHLAPGAEELLSQLKERKIPFILASASIMDNIDFYFETFHLEQWLSKELCVYDDGSYANKGEMHQEAAKRLNVPLSECLVIEDSISAISHAQSVGAGMIVGIGDKSKQPDLIRAGADLCICDFTEFQYEWLAKEIPE